MSSTRVSISALLQKTEQVFSEGNIPTPHLDAEVLLAHALGANRPYLHAHANKLLQGLILVQFEKSVKRRLRREPIAYITGKKEFYGREFIVSPDVLIPRPETEELVELALASVPDKASIVDIGCGSGCIGISLKLERPELDVTLSDISPKALDIAKKNTKNLGANVSATQSDLLASFSDAKFDCILANLPYVDKTWETSPETAHEPTSALYAEDSGLELIKQLIAQSPDALNKRGLLLLEADPEQHEAIISFAIEHGFEHQATRGYALCLMKLPQV